MLKQAIVGTAAVAVLGGLVMGRDTWSYCSTSFTSVREAIKREVPLEFEVQRARDMVAQVDGEVRKCLHVIAEEEVNVEELRRTLDQELASHQVRKEQILVQRRDLAQKKDVYTYGHRTYTVSEVERDLGDRFARYQTVSETIQNRREVLSAREKALSAARQKLEGMLDAKEQLLVQVENLDARLKTLQAAQVATAVVTVDDSQVARTRQLISRLNREIEVRQRLADSSGQVSGQIPIPVSTESGPGPDVASQIDKYFGISPEVQVGQDKSKEAAGPAPSTAAL